MLLSCGLQKYIFLTDDQIVDQKNNIDFVCNLYFYESEFEFLGI